jgi:tRNA (adenine57-N1/adenine58-N1)-methyltransferase catalytic subunit
LPVDQDSASRISEWKSNRKAIIHTVDISPVHSAHAQNIVQGFRHGVYAGNVDFYTGDLPVFFDMMFKNAQKQSRFLSHILLDMPSSHEQLGLVANHMRNDAKLLVFNPSVTQIADCVQVVHNRRLPLRLDRVVELAGSFSGGRDWDVRIAQVKKPKQVKSPSWLRRVLDAVMNRPPHVNRSSHAIVCRPMAGERIVVGGFVGLWTRSNSMTVTGG